MLKIKNRKCHTNRTCSVILSCAFGSIIERRLVNTATFSFMYRETRRNICYAHMLPVEMSIYGLSFSDLISSFSWDTNSNSSQCLYQIKSTIVHNSWRIPLYNIITIMTPIMGGILVGKNTSGHSQQVFVPRKFLASNLHERVSRQSPSFLRTLLCTYYTFT